MTSKTPTALVTDEIDKESDGEAAARKARQLDQDLKTLLKEANEVSVQKLKFYENLLGKNRDNLKLIQSTQGLGVSKSSRRKIGGLAKGFREGIDLASPCTHRQIELNRYSDLMEPSQRQDAMAKTTSFKKKFSKAEENARKLKTIKNIRVPQPNMSVTNALAFRSKSVTALRNRKQPSHTNTDLMDSDCKMQSTECLQTGSNTRPQTREQKTGIPNLLTGNAAKQET